MDAGAAFPWEYSSSQCPETDFQNDNRRPPLSSHSMRYYSFSSSATEPVGEKILLTDVQDLKSDNVLMTLRDQFILDAVAHNEVSSPLERS